MSVQAKRGSRLIHSNQIHMNSLETSSDEKAKSQHAATKYTTRICLISCNIKKEKGYLTRIQASGHLSSTHHRRTDNPSI